MNWVSHVYASHVISGRTDADLLRIALTLFPASFVLAGIFFAPAQAQSS